MEMQICDCMENTIHLVMSKIVQRPGRFHREGVRGGRAVKHPGPFLRDGLRGDDPASGTAPWPFPTG